MVCPTVNEPPHTALLSIARVSLSVVGDGVTPVVVRFGALVVMPLARAVASERQVLPSMVTDPPLRLTPSTKPDGGGAAATFTVTLPELPTAPRLSMARAESV